MRSHGSKFDNILPVLAIGLMGVVLYRMAKAQKAKMASQVTASTAPFVPTPDVMTAITSSLPSGVSGLGRYAYGPGYYGR